MCFGSRVVGRFESTGHYINPVTGIDGKAWAVRGLRASIPCWSFGPGLQPGKLHGVLRELRLKGRRCLIILLEFPLYITEKEKQEHGGRCYFD
jgi:hypothetical protein